jgi:hypothetical protein
LAEHVGRTEISEALVGTAASTLAAGTSAKHVGRTNISEALVGTATSTLAAGTSAEQVGRTKISEALVGVCRADNSVSHRLRLRDKLVKCYRLRPPPPLDGEVWKDVIFYVGKALLPLEPLLHGQDLPEGFASILAQVMSNIPQNLMQHVQKCGMRSEAGDLLLEVVEDMVHRMLS